MNTQNENVMKFQQFMQIKGMDSLTFEQKIERLKNCGIPYYIQNGYLVFGHEECCEEMIEATDFSIMHCMSEIVEDLKTGEGKEQKFNKDIYQSKAREIEYVSKMCGITHRQAVILASIIEQSGRRHFCKEDLAGWG